jgi:hypothetical protein
MTRVTEELIREMAAVVAKEVNPLLFFGNALLTKRIGP